MTSLPSYSAEDHLLVDLGPRSYAIHIGAGLLDQAGMFMASVLQQKRVFIVSDTHVAPLYVERLYKSLTKEGISATTTVLPAGEKTKSFPVLEQLLDSLLAARCERRIALVALGGGVIGDVTGFAAAILLRGIDYVQIPTTLLAQVDSAVGGKTGIDTPYGKNLIGAFHQPRLVIIDITTLDTLSLRAIRAGYAEVVKYSCLDSPSFFNWLELNGPRLLAGDAEARHYAVLRSCAAKARVVAADEREEGPRALLNLGHTFGHALEVETGFREELLQHGESVAVGMVLAFDLSVRLGICPAAEADRLRHHLTAVGLPVTIRQALASPPEPTRLLAHMARDKKVHDGNMTFIIARGIGRAFLDRTVGTDHVLAVLAESAGI
ncbi:3-dehydroquinate synthase [invertebrate metagenome]|uniref:3-dehydroquinate synthase n=1 Tax=invertebrate metagenome TaxID=1711999 RepID=A0A484HBK7_9ZZZZ